MSAHAAPMEAPAAAEEDVTDLTIVYCSDEADAQLLRRFLADWAGSGLLHADLWLLTGHPEGALWPAQPVSFVDQNHGAGREELSSALAARKYTMIRVVNVTLTGGKGRPAPEAVSAVRDYVKERIPANLASVVTINLIVPTSREPANAGDPAGLALGADLNIIATPEDQKSSHHPWQVFESREQYAAWGATVAATVAGLWAGVQRGPLDQQVGQLVQGKPTGVVGRAFVRLIDGGFLVDHIGAGLVGRFDEWPVPAGLGPADDLVEQRATAIHRLAGQFLDVDSGALRFQCAPAKQRPPREELVWWRAFLLMFQFIANAIRRAPTNFVRGLKEKVRRGAASWAQAATVGKNSAFVVTFGGLRADGDPAARPRTADEVRATAASIVDLLGDRNPPPASPKAWFDLRRLTFGLADGTDLPTCVDSDLIAEGSRRLVVRTADALAPDPADAPLILHDSLFAAGQPLEPFAGRVVRSCDAYQCQEMDDALQLALRHIDDDKAPLENESLDPTVVPDAHAFITDHGTAGDPSDEEGADVRVGEDGEPSGPAGTEEEPSTHSDGELTKTGRVTLQARFAQASAAINEWVGARRDALLWQIGEGLSGELNAAITEYVRAMKIVERGRPPTSREAMKKARRGLWVRWLLIFLAVAALTVVGWLVLSLPILAATLIAIPLILGGWFVAFIRFQRRMFQYQYRDASMGLEYDYAEESAWIAAGEILKLSDRYLEFLDWAEVIGSFIHRPWGNPPELQRAAAAADLEDVPRAVGTAQGFVTEASVRSMRARAVRRIITTGWLTNLFEPIRTEVLEAIRTDLGLDALSEVADPEADTGSGRDAPRQRVLRHFERGEYSASSRRRFEEQVVSFCRELKASDAFEYVQVDLRPGDEPVRASEQAVTSTADTGAIRLTPLPATRTRGGVDARTVVQASLDTVVHLHITTPSGDTTGSGVMLRHDGYLVTNAHVVEDADKIVVEFADGVAVGGEVRGVAASEDLAVVVVDRSDVKTARPRRDPVEVGQPVVAIGNPMGFSGGPSVSTGIVSATNRQLSNEERALSGLIQTDAAISPGSSGGGLFDEHGELAGVTTGVSADSRAENIGLAIPVAEALDLLNRTVHGQDDEATSDQPTHPGSPSGTDDEQTRLGMVYDDVDEFLFEIAPQEGDRLGDVCWQPRDRHTHDVAEASHLWHPPEVTGHWPDSGDVLSVTVVQPRVALGHKLAYAACRLDLSPIGLRENIAILGDDDKRPPAQPTDDDRPDPPIDNPVL